MNMEQMKQIHTGKGFIAALDQSGGSTPKALALYGIPENDYQGDEEMFRKVHNMRSRIIKSPAFTSKHILGAILFEKTMNSTIDGKLTADYLWDDKQIIPFLKIDKGLADQENGVQLMKPMPELSALLESAVKRNIFGTKMRSVINESNPAGIRKIVDQQFDIALQIASYGLVPILEPEVNIHIIDKKECETILKNEVEKHLDKLKDDVQMMFKFSIPTTPGFYTEMMNDPHIVRIVALSGGYSQEEANKLLALNPGLIASFSRALSAGLSALQTDSEFNDRLARSITAIYNASTAEIQ